MKDSDWFVSWFNTYYYHILYKDRNYDEAEAFIDKLLSHIQLPKNSYVLDLACGKGRHSITLSEYGYRVLGVDLSEQSIEYANEYKRVNIIENTNLEFRVHDMREIIPDKQFDAIFNFFTSFGYFNDCTDNIQMLRSVGAMLVPDGLFLMDFMNVKKVVSNLVEKEIKVVDGITFHIQRRTDSHYLFKDIKFEDNGEDHHHTERVQLLYLDSFEHLFAKTGFDIIDVFGDYQLNAFDVDNSNRLIILARKR